MYLAISIASIPFHQSRIDQRPELFLLPWCCLFSISFEYLEWRLCCISGFSQVLLQHVRDLVPSSLSSIFFSGVCERIAGQVATSSSAMMLNDRCSIRRVLDPPDPTRRASVSPLHSHLPTPQVLLLLPSHCSGCSNPLLDSLVKSNPALIYLLLGRKSLLSACIFWQNLLSTRLYNCNLLPASRSCAECGVEW